MNSPLWERTAQKKTSWIRSQRLGAALAISQRMLCLSDYIQVIKGEKACLLPFQTMRTGHFLTMSLIKRNTTSIGSFLISLFYLPGEITQLCDHASCCLICLFSSSCPGEAGRVVSFTDHLWLTSLSILILAKQANSCFDILFAIDIPCVLFVFIYNYHRQNCIRNKKQM